MLVVIECERFLANFQRTVQVVLLLVHFWTHQLPTRLPVPSIFCPVQSLYLPLQSPFFIADLCGFLLIYRPVLSALHVIQARAVQSSHKIRFGPLPTWTTVVWWSAAVQLLLRVHCRLHFLPQQAVLRRPGQARSDAAEILVEFLPPPKGALPVGIPRRTQYGVGDAL
jgi:hypothetical protein